MSNKIPYKWTFENVSLVPGASIKIYNGAYTAEGIINRVDDDNIEVEIERDDGFIYREIIDKENVFMLKKNESDIPCVILKEEEDVEDDAVSIMVEYREIE
jgi:hypothetical protein